MRNTPKGIKLSPLLIAAVMLLPCTSIANETASTRFDGKWNTALNCTPFQDAQGFTWHFVSEVKNGHLVGHFGTEGQPASIRVEGQLADNGTGTLHATGRTGMPQYVTGNPQRGSNIVYDIRAEFHEDHGKGTRLEGRPCTYEFERQ
ncbi:MAG: hypothetical protein ABSA42_11600 [Terracidiphilus sp.]|jgi:hypothetical protein